MQAFIWLFSTFFHNFLLKLCGVLDMVSANLLPCISLGERVVVGGVVMTPCTTTAGVLSPSGTADTL